MSQNHTTGIWIATPVPQAQAAMRLFCLPYAGSGAAAFRQWAALLPATVELCCVQLPGRESRMAEPALDQLTRLVPPLAQAMQPLLDRPFALFGPSMGALIAFELARYLRRVYGRGPRLLAVAAQRAPQFPDSDRPISGLPDDAFLAAVRGLNGIPDEVLRNQEWLRMLLPTLRADFALCETYRYTPGPPLPCPITAFGGQDDPAVGREHLAGWSLHTAAAFSCHILPGDHFVVHQSLPPLIEALGRDLHAGL